MLAILPVERFTREMGELAGKIDAGMKKVGLMIVTADLLIGIAVIRFGYAVGARSVRQLEFV